MFSYSLGSELQWHIYKDIVGQIAGLELQPNLSTTIASYKNNRDCGRLTPVTAKQTQSVSAVSAQKPTVCPNFKIKILKKRLLKTS